MSNENSDTSIHFATGLVALAICIFFAAQIGSIAQGAKIINWQISSNTTQSQALDDTEKQLRELSVQREALVKQSEQVKSQYVALLNDVLELAKTDDDTKTIVEKWNIRQQQPAEDTAPKTEP